MIRIGLTFFSKSIFPFGTEVGHEGISSCSATVLSVHEVSPQVARAAEDRSRKKECFIAGNRANGTRQFVLSLILDAYCSGRIYTPSTANASARRPSWSAMAGW